MAAEYFSTGYLAALCQQPVAEIERRAQRAGVEPALCINGVRHYDSDGASTILRNVEADEKAIAKRQRANRQFARQLLDQKE